ncbi:ethylene-responsive transcription factor 1-like [Triticum aestivum]|nr:ethylene-responsive transcription factor 1-like [Triticum aestivum]
MAAQLWPDAYFPAERAASGRRRRRAAATTDDEFEAEFQVFAEEEDDDYAAPPAAACAAVALSSRRRRVAGAKSTKYRRVRRRLSGRWAAEDTQQRQRVWLGTCGGDAEEAAPLYDSETRRVRGKSARLDSPNEGCSRRRSLPGIIDLNQPPAVSDDHMVSADADACKTKIMQLIAEGPRGERVASLVSELMDGAHQGSETRASVVVMRCAALISRCSREMEEVAALRRDLENRARRLDERKDQLVRIASLLGSELLID